MSQIISHHKGKGFNDYINDLKIDYIITLLKEDRKIRNYTNTALAEEAGFSTTQRFVHAFKANTKMPPSYFIEELKNGMYKTSEEI
ncbi:helix-turn-helix domain-containing protein [Flavobacterium gyeonganense]|uniref:helix-turn-helix domain-containing protein n=1 Tax=Flavobacterium gyeonganense TaxID=1310418 RepID=UPI0024142A14|nr:helix-turn-helix domain-containing protein [Flavobacterium gyeonganense]